MRSMKLAAVCMLVAVGCSRAAAPVATGSVQSALTSTTCTNTTLPSWPTSWATMLCHGTPASDPVGDASPAIIDAVGTSSFPAVESAIDANFLYLRIRSNLSVGSSACTCTSCTNDKINDAHGWGFDFDTDGNPTTYEFQILMNGASNQSGRTLEFNQNLLQSGAVDNPSEKAETPACIYAGADADARVRVDKASDGSLLGGDCDYFISAAFPLSELAQRGYDMKAARLVWAGSSAQAQNLSGDIVCDNQGSPKLSTSEGDPMSMCFGGCCTSDADCSAGHPTTSTTLSAALTATATTASVVSTTGYPTSGVLLVDSENIAYSGVTATSFTGLTRGALGTTAAAHASGATASDYFGNKFCNTSTGTCGCSTSPDSCPSGEFCDPNTKSCRKDCTSAAPQGGSCSTTGDMTLCCDDGNSCTTNACVSGKCVYTATGNGTKCEDYNSCTGAGATETATCSNGVCGALVVGCTDDGLGCTSDVCESYDGTCVHPLKSAGTVCRAASGSCDVAETCNGTSTACPADAKQPDNSPCSDGNACTSGETCKAGVCGSPTSTVSCNNPPACKSSVGASCDPSTGACSYPTSIVGQSCASGAGGGCNCGTAVCDTTGNASPGICETANTCGNGLVEAGEGCDDGNSVAGDGCDASCKIEDGRACSANSAGVTGDASCASGVCDAVGNAAPGKCEPANTCGNGKLEAGEGCDDGNTSAGDGCNGSCLVESGGACNANPAGATGSASCASSVCDATGNTAPGKCEPANTCGNGKLEAGEGCDDGNLTAGDGCNGSCKIEDGGTCNANASGATGSASCQSGVCDASGNPTPGKCEPANVCGNGKLEAGEGCDDGNLTAGDGCNGSCKIENTLACNGNSAGATGNASCASGVCDTAGFAAPGVCEPAGSCGNGVLDAGEGCDDGRTVSGDGCSATCKVENTFPCNATAPGATGNASCASGLCDQSGGTPGVCKASNVCGNGVLEAGEGCDDGGNANNDGCNASCLVENGAACNANASGLVGDASCASSVCDATGNSAPGKCEPAATCGNGKLEAGEGCDDGNLTAGDGCDGSCKIENGGSCNENAAGTVGSASCQSGVCDTAGNTAPGKCEPANTCGNGKLEAGEGCDDGNVSGGDGCNGSCKIEDTLACNATAPGATGSASCASGVCDTLGNTAPGKCEPAGTCGNGKLEAGEGCDDGNIVGGDGCNASCKIEDSLSCNADGAGATGDASCASGVCDTTGIASPGVCAPANTCGNGKLEAGEGCDDGNTTSLDGCDSACKVENGVACNATSPGAVGNASCESGLCNATGGAPGVCAALNSCGNGVLEAGEGCDDGNSGDNDGCDSACKIEDGAACNVNAPGVTGSASCASSVCNTTAGQPGVCAPANACGNGKLEAGEGCDDGNVTPGDGCDGACKVENGASCNANMAGLTGNASCESGLCNSSGGAPGVCAALNACGNGVLEAGEGCDDGNALGGDGCSTACLVENGGSCNGGPAGVTGSASCQSGVCDTLGNTAPGKCEPANTCGNGTLEANEGCDDGNTASGDGCDAACKVENGGACNATAPGLTGAGSCASGVCDTVGNSAPGRCEAANTCGNGVLEAGEGCDDGATANGDGCNASCKIENGGACNANGAGATGNDSCASNLCNLAGGAPGVCQASNTCGNGILEAGEGCDDGGTVAGDGCSASCLVENGSSCNNNSAGATGNAGCQSGLCDTVGNTAPGKCEAANSCGNGKLEAGEGCDDGNTAAGDGCNGSCKIENGVPCNVDGAGTTGGKSCASGICDVVGNAAPGRCEPANSCGNGLLEAGEGCDDGNVASNDGCSATCKLEDGRACNTAPPGATGGSSCASGICDTVGNAAPGQCEPANRCGNGVVEAGEGCDDGNTAAGDGCGATCKLEDGRACNGGAAGASGAASCLSGVCDAVGNPQPGVCEHANVCGNGVVEAGEDCDDGNTVDGDGCAADCKVAPMPAPSGFGFAGGGFGCDVAATGGGAGGGGGAGVLSLLIAAALLVRRRRVR